MTPEERIQKSEQIIRAEKKKIAEAKKEANQIRRGGLPMVKNISTRAQICGRSANCHGGH